MFLHVYMYSTHLQGINASFVTAHALNAEKGDSYNDKIILHLGKPNSLKQDHVNSVCRSLVICETFATLNFGVIWLLHIHAL